MLLISASAQRLCGVFCYAFAAYFAAPLRHLCCTLVRLWRAKLTATKGESGEVPRPQRAKISRSLLRFWAAPLRRLRYALRRFCCAFAAPLLRLCCAFAAPLLRLCCAFAAPLLRLCCAFAAPLAAPLATPLRRLYGVFATHSTAPLRRFLLRLCGAFAAPLAASLLRLGGVVAASSLRFCEAFGAFFARQVDDEINLW